MIDIPVSRRNEAGHVILLSGGVFNPRLNKNKILEDVGILQHVRASFQHSFKRIRFKLSVSVYQRTHLPDSSRLRHTYIKATDYVLRHFVRLRKHGNFCLPENPQKFGGMRSRIDEINTCDPSLCVCVGC